MLFATILPVILWQQSKFYWIHYREKCLTLGNQYLFILGVLIGQCINSRNNYFFWLSKLTLCCFEAGQKLPLRLSLQLLGAIWCLSAVVFASAYVGILMSFLRFPKLLPIINQLEELPGSHLKWVVLRGTALDSLFLVCSVYKLLL